MRVGSLVRYIEGHDRNGHRLKPLYTDRIYTVSCVCHGKFHILGWQPAIYLKEEGNVYAFRADMFIELHTITESLTTETHDRL